MTASVGCDPRRPTVWCSGARTRTGSAALSGGRWRDTPYHYVELNGLEPGQTYYYQARSNGKLVAPTPFTLISGNAVGTSDYGLTTGGPYSFTVPEPPPGRFLFSIALCNDLHMGETTAGLLGGTEIKGIQQVPGLPPYPEVMLESLVTTRARSAHRSCSRPATSRPKRCPST